MYANTTGHENMGVGGAALQQNTTGYYNTAGGYAALYHNLTGIENTAFGTSALNVNNDGNTNTAIGYAALYGNGGNGNIALGYEAGYNIVGNSNICIGNLGSTADSRTIRIGTNQTQTFVSGIYGATVASGVEVVVNSYGQWAPPRFRPGSRRISATWMTPATFYCHSDR